MLQTKSILTEICNSKDSGVYNLTQEDLKRLQNRLFRMYRDIEAVCKRHNLGICLAYGNVLGAVRHEGWIPWDDDLDIHMSREDYELLLTKYASELPAQYHISSYHSPKGSYARFAKIIDTSTIYIPIGAERSEDSGVFIDIFPIDNVSTHSFLNKIKRFWSFFMMYTATSVMQVEEQSQTYKELMFSCKEGKLNWRFRQAWGRLFSFASSRTWHRWIEKYAQNSDSTGKVHIMADLMACYKMIPDDVLLPFREIELPEIGKVHVPNKYEEYLNFFYGEWREIPEDADKWHHYVSELYIPD